MPLALGGGIRRYEDAARLIADGADKVVVNSACYQDPTLIRAIADDFGSQAVVVGIDVRGEEGSWRCFSACGRQHETCGLDEHLERVVAAGAGEIMIQSIDRDGSMGGYDLALLRHVVERVDLPVIGAGGSGCYEHLRDAFLGTGCAALACGSIFNFSDSNPIRAKAFLANHGIPCKVI
jgi:cyclase